MRPKPTMPCLEWLYWLLCYLWASMTPSGQGVFVGLGGTFLIFTGTWLLVFGIVLMALFIDLVILTLYAMFSVIAGAKKKTANVIAERRWRIQQQIAAAEAKAEKEALDAEERKAVKTPEEMVAAANELFRQKVALVEASELEREDKDAYINAFRDQLDATLRRILG